jgi:hypothetical protein
MASKWDNRCHLIAGRRQGEEIQICLNCPLPNCVYDPNNKMHTTATTPTKGRLQLRNAEIATVASVGKTSTRLATLFNIHRRTIQKVLNQARHMCSAGAPPPHSTLNPGP